MLGADPGPLDGDAVDRGRVPHPGATLAVFALVAVLSLLGALRGLGREHLGFLPLEPFSLDGERNAIAIASALGLLAAAGLAARLADRTFRALAALFAFMAADDLFAIPEHLEGALHVDWQLLYLPVGVGAGVLWHRALRSFAERGLRLAWIGAAAAWVAAQAFEKIQYSGDTLVHGWASLPEETLEMSGTALFALTLLAAA